MSWIKKLVGGKPSKDEFVDIVKKELRQLGFEGVEYNDEEYSLNLVEPESSIDIVLYLGNSYDEYCSMPQKDRKGFLRSFLRQLSSGFEIPDTLDGAIERVLPYIQSRAFFEETKLSESMMSTQSTDPVYATLAKHFAKTLVYDSDDRLAYLHRGRLDDWGCQFDELFNRSLDNLKAKTPEPFELIAPGIYISQYNDSYDATRLLLTDRVKECKVQGRPVAMAPNRDVLIITGESDPDGHRVMLDIVEEVIRQPRPLLALPVVLSETEWHAFQPGEHNVEKDRFDKLRLYSLADVYNPQKELMDRIHEQEDTDVFVGTYMIISKRDQEDFSSHSVWSKGIELLLPVVDSVSLVDGENVICVVPWSVLREVVGDLMTPVDCYPERYRVEVFPDDAQIKVLKKSTLF